MVILSVEWHADLQAKEIERDFQSQNSNFTFSTRIPLKDPPECLWRNLAGTGTFTRLCPGRAPGSPQTNSREGAPDSCFLRCLPEIRSFHVGDTGPSGFSHSTESSWQCLALEKHPWRLFVSRFYPPSLYRSIRRYPRLYPRLLAQTNCTLEPIVINRRLIRWMWIISPGRVRSIRIYNYNLGN